MGFLQDTLDKFRNDENWNTLERNGSRRFDEKIIWIETMINEYASALKVDPNEVAQIMEKKRDYSWPNYYQPSNFPGISNDGVIGVFETYQDFREHAKENWDGFKCPKCGEVSTHPQECRHRLEKDKKCDWCAYGLFRNGRGVIIIESGLDLIPIFEPVLKKKKEDI